MSKSKAVAVYQPPKFPAMERAKTRTEKRAIENNAIDRDDFPLLTEIAGNWDVQVALETVLRFAKNGRWVEEWESDLADTLNAYFRGNKS